MIIGFSPYNNTEESKIKIFNVILIFSLTNPVSRTIIPSKLLYPHLIQLHLKINNIFQFQRYDISFNFVSFYTISNRLTHSRWTEKSKYFIFSCLSLPSNGSLYLLQQSRLGFVFRFNRPQHSAQPTFEKLG